MADARPWTGAGIAPTVRRVVLSHQLAQLRKEAGVSLDEAAGLIHTTALTVRRIERAEFAVRLVYVQQLLPYYLRDRPAEERERITADLLELAGDANQPGWWADYRDAMPTWLSPLLSLEDEASLIRSYNPHFVPGILQTAEYARAQLLMGAPDAPAEQIERAVQVRLLRQERLERHTTPVRLWLLLEQNVFARPVGDAAVMRGQMDRLLDLWDQEHITLQVLPFTSGAHPGAYGAYSLYRLRTQVLPDVVYVENLTRGSYIDDPDEVGTYLETLDRMAGSYAVSRSATRNYLEHVRKEYV
ncbi:DUF5753 domain-containing protein [Streptomyces sp. NPDC046805]|uniref:DUF5753 domain-containing protein n=1 Tax=Streptomyces sp. NPDC046805 TaxID=3155134 RepID=UPI00340197DC